MSFEIIQSSDLVRITGHTIKDQSTLLKGVPVNIKHQKKSALYSVQVWVKSDSLPVKPAMGQLWEVEGCIDKHWLDQGHYRHEIRVYQNPNRVEFCLPNDGETFIQFVAKDPEFKGIGESKARELWAKYGPNIHNMLQEKGAKHLEGFRTILSDKSIKALYAGYEKYQNLKHTIWMSQAGIPATVQRRVLKYHHTKTIEALKQNPYELANFGVKISDIDQFIKTSGAWRQTSYPKERMRAAAVIALNKLLADGSTYTRPSLVETKVFDILKNHKQSKEAVEYLQSSISVAVYNEEEDRLHPASTAIQELAVAKRFKRLSTIKTTLTPNDRDALNQTLGTLEYELTEKQLQAVTVSLEHQISCITGGAGTGKTTVLNTLLKTAQKLGYEIHAVALSGRAAMRLHESIGLLTSTIARFLRGDPVISSDGRKQLIVIDEASMVDLPTMFKIVNQTCPYTKLIFTGDPNQLPPIGKGKILHDMIQSGVIANTTLDIVKRQKGDTGIPLYSKTINNGKVPESLNYGNVFFYEVDKDQALSTAVNLYGLDPESSRVVAPTRGLVGDINTLIQSKFNSESEIMQFNLDSDDYYVNFRLNDQILFTKNHYHLGVQNGSIGKLVSVKQTAEAFGQVRLDNGELIEITQELLNCMQLGYAITLHKAQGSQFPRIIVVLQDGRITDRAWLYTAITRAEHEVHIVGQAKTLEKVTIEQPTAFRRKTLLQQLIRFI
ncbi:MULTISPECIES: AAA family ATPase [unclassified Marinobacterium]|uniref:AAA family ATPase n=1 Tax=unclassified Marinobacterium TaxID=2644139 RepID=UPI001569B287|nr:MULTISPECIES: AAA family ATPase [unclassified Marinobacterium]NRP10377.1 ATP-dependent RecD-like DNA helicase [Marinobacterium sp. xm-g-48]NRP83476.1 ATP-dependent RecD-like DNA helicase [Marinobacterium sp. xm-d-509]